MVSPQMADLSAFYNNLMSRGRLDSLGRPTSGRRDSSQRYRRPSNSLPGKSASRGSLQGQQVPQDQLSVSVGKRTISKSWLACVVCIFVLVLAPLTMLLAKHFMEPPFASGRGVCDSEDCVRHARQILRTMNASADPCLGFHAYVCGSGAAPGNGGEAQSDDSSRKTDAGIGSLDEIDPAWRLARLYAYQVNNVLGNLPQLLAVNKTSDTTLKAFTALSLCLQREGQQHSRSFASFMRDRNLPWPLDPPRSVGLLDVVDVLLDLSINWRASIWIDVRLWHLKTQPFSGPVVVFDEPGHVPIIRMEQMSTANDIEYANAVERTAQFIVGSKKSSATTTRGASLIHAVEIEQLKRDETYVREAVLPMERREDTYDTLVPLHMMRLTTNFTMEMWVDLFRKYFKPAGINVTIDTALLILNNQHFKALTKLMGNVPAPRLLSVLGWMFAYSYSWIANAEFEFFSNQGGLTSGGPSKHGLFAHVLCFVAVHESFGISLEAAMFLHQLPSDERLKVTKIVNATARGLVETVRASRGVSNTTKADAEAKISSAVTRELWPPLPFLNPDRLDALYSGFPSVRASDFYASWLESRIALRASLSNRYHGTLMTAKLREYEEEILYIYSINIMLLDLASVFPPMYLKDGNSIMTFAGLGFQLLRQLVKSVDERGRQVDYATGKKISWWEENRACKIKKATSAKERREIKDLFALELALAIAEKVAEADGLPLRLKFLENLSPVQTFYVSYCSHFCGERGEQGMCDLAMKTSEFVEAFACLWRGADLGNNDGRCVPVWKCYTYKHPAWFEKLRSSISGQAAGGQSGNWGASSGANSGSSSSVNGQWSGGYGQVTGQPTGSWVSAPVFQPGGWGGMNGAQAGSWSYGSGQYPGAWGVVTSQYPGSWGAGYGNWGLGNGNWYTVRRQ
ncbi:hypothetical protein HPB49_023046 [Dermacentor silvarum]|uniref:Uncharacterized protein n=1 Tax=Dermacentor silvarum TaxID=543639 RepID=A0ACB8CTD7_DERSI|nr:hypothetical protein HPB49_023046 [Dermacentor silvarum]